MNTRSLIELAFLFPIVLMSLSCHEFAHGWMALRRGDSTARDVGRLSINPIAHIDLVGTLLLPGICLIMGMPLIGWAKPVPVDVRRLHRGRQDLALVALAGPVSNFLIALASTLILGLVLHNAPQNQASFYVQMALILLVQFNLALGVFNLLPVPPLDGFNIVQGVLPDRLVLRIAPFSRGISLVLLGLVLIGGLSFLTTPIHFLFEKLIWMIE